MSTISTIPRYGDGFQGRIDHGMGRPLFKASWNVVVIWPKAF
jgi:hypothetical protein